MKSRLAGSIRSYICFWLGRGGIGLCCLDGNSCGGLFDTGDLSVLPLVVSCTFVFFDFL